MEAYFLLLVTKGFAAGLTTLALELIVIVGLLFA